MKGKIIKTILLLLLQIFTLHSFAQPGTLDSSFGIKGKITTGFGYPHNVYPAAIATQKDGKIIVLSGMYPYNDSFNLILVRYLSNGIVDSSFGTNGRINARFGDSIFYVYTGPQTMLIQDDDKILVGGTATLAYDAHFRLMRFLPNGKIDSSFGVNGQVKTTIVPWRETFLSSIAIQPDGKILAGGEVDGFCLVRYKPNGSIDSSFGTNGLVYNEADFRVIVSLAVLSNQRIVCAVNGPSYPDTIKIQLETLLPNGKIDSSFGTNGIVTTDLAAGTNFNNSLAVLPDNSIIVSGQKSVKSNEWQLALCGFKKNGAINPRFGNNGYVIQSFGSSNSFAQKILVQNDGKLLTSGSVLARFHSNGSVDSGFGINGTAINFEITGRIALQKDGKIIALNNTDPYTWSVSRYKGDEPVSIKIQKDISLAEGNAINTPANFKIALNRASEYDVQINYKTVDGSAVAGSDYIASTGNATIKAGKTSTNISVNIIGDMIPEPNEKFSLALSDIVNATAGTKDTAICTIKNDDLQPLITANSPEEKIILNEGVKVYPNPAKDFVKLEGLGENETSHISLLDMKGNILSTATSSENSYRMNLQHLPAGIYEILIEKKNKTEKIKLIKG